MGQTDAAGNLERPQDLMTSMENEKLRLEIDKLKLEKENLRKKNKWEPYSPLVSLLAPLVTVIALFIGFLQFQRQQKDQQAKAITEQQTERATRLQNQFRSDADELSRFTQDKNQTLSRVSYLLDDMKILIDSAHWITNEQSFQAFIGDERKVTKTLVNQIVNDADFMKNPRDVLFANTVAGNWSDYRNYLKDGQQLSTLNDILYRYVRALRYLREGNPSYFKEVKHEEGHYTLPATFEKLKDEESAFQHFKHAMEGFKEHLNLIPNDSKGGEIKLEKIRAFGDAVCIESVARHVLGDQDFVRRPCMER